jgi:hypothetical protein
MAQVAQETFVAELADGSSLHVARGSTWADRHEVVKMDAGRGHLFKPLDLDEADAPKSEAEAGPDPGPDPGAGPEVTPEPEPGAPPAEPAAAPVSAARPRRGAKASS